MVVAEFEGRKVYRLAYVGLGEGVWVWAFQRSPFAKLLGSRGSVTGELIPAPIEKIAALSLLRPWVELSLYCSALRAWPRQGSRIDTAVS
jgi:hypothetical protein